MRATLQSLEIAPQKVCIQVNVGALMEDVAHSEQLLRAIKAMGMRLSLDDFGTRYSSLSNLKRFPFDKVKIDKAFVRDIAKSPQDEVIAKVVIATAH
ncbi:MAG: EAL domain-containing protein [Rhodoferax sp.]|nr:EAL domain-containing protein [Rhodoferax sp.]